MPDSKTPPTGSRPVCTLLTACRLTSRLATRLLRCLLLVMGWAATIFFTIVLVRAFDARGKSDLKLWHQVHLDAEFHARELTDHASLADYLAMEDRLFAELDAKVTRRLPPEDCIDSNRYWPGSRSYPSNLPFDGNRTFALAPEGPPRGGVLMLHGLTDAPYSMRHLAEIYREQGFYVLSLRLPGHGTLPGELLRADWQDWLAAARLGARSVREQTGPGKSFHVVGYSNGGALALKLTLDAIEQGDGSRPDRLVLLSPMIGVTPVSRFARLVTVVSVFPYFEKSRWLDIMPEYIPYKYNSFCAKAARQSYELSSIIRRQILTLEKSGRVAELPPILTFQSIVDATVSTRAVIADLYDHIRDPRSRLVVFDVNSQANIRPFIKPSDLTLVERLLGERTRRYRLAVIENVDPHARAVLELSAEADSGDILRRPLDLAWPQAVYSLAHTALPIAPEDPVYGFDGLVGGITPYGEKGVLTVPVAQFMRLNCNPFFPYLREQLEAWLAADAEPELPERLRR